MSRRKNEKRIFLKGVMKSFEEYIREIEPDIRQKAVSYCGNWQIRGLDWEDLAQEFRIQLRKKFPKYEPTKASFRTWANKVMLNRVKDIARASQAKKRQPLNRAISIDELKDSGIDIGYSVDYGGIHDDVDRFWRNKKVKNAN